jgi:DNA-binding transcriptional regulator YdaS (Cro superfamily)
MGMSKLNARNARGIYIESARGSKFVMNKELLQQIPWQQFLKARTTGQVLKK